ncbi:fucose mutarotase isoform X2 [Sarcophilus harrisii]|uniref:fucose mutarotase isoform X2 n=1 Tax=Sarcophilus harrisii TaxID=9305 RepID=UPI001301D9DF|nr:fucose mutarotase isoform X2 [Sarcophilus harrisii]
MVMLKGIPELLSPELLFALAKMGHGDEIVLADANFPTSSICQCGPVEVRADGLSIPQLLESILKLLPLDTYEPNSVVIMDLVESDKARGLQIPVWETYKSLLLKAGLKASETLPDYGSPVVNSVLSDAMERILAWVSGNEGSIPGSVCEPCKHG